MPAMTIPRKTSTEMSRCVGEAGMEWLMNDYPPASCGLLLLPLIPWRKVRCSLYSQRSANNGNREHLMKRFLRLAVFAVSIPMASGLRAAEFENLAPKARAFRQGQSVPVQPDGIIVAEAEE